MSGNGFLKVTLTLTFGLKNNKGLQLMKGIHPFMFAGLRSKGTYAIKWKMFSCLFQ